MLSKIRFQSEQDALKIEDEYLRNHILSYSSVGSMQNVYDHMRMFHEWLQENGNPTLRGKSPTELVEYQHQLNLQSIQSLKLVNKRVIMNDLVRWSSSDPTWRSRYKRKLLSDVSAFFSRTLADNGGFPKLEKVDRNKLKGQPRVHKKLDFDTLRAVAGKSNELYKAIFEIQACSGMGEGEIIEWSNQGMQSLSESMMHPIHDHPDVIMVTLSPRKGSETDFYTFIGGSALKALKVWLKKREKMQVKHPIGFPTSIFVSNWSTPLDERNISEYFLKQIKRLGLYAPKEGGKNQRSGLNAHLVRDVFKTQWEKSRAYPPIAESFMGHTVDPLDYSRIMDDKDWVLGEYKKALPYIDITHDDPSLMAQTIDAQNKKIDTMQRTIEMLMAQVYNSPDGIAVRKAVEEAEEREREDEYRGDEDKE